jgi:hypothetical protein
MLELPCCQAKARNKQNTGQTIVQEIEAATLFVLQANTFLSSMNHNLFRQNKAISAEWRDSTKDKK